MTTPIQVTDNPAPPLAWRAAPSPVAVLRACGWLSANDATHAALRVDAAKSSHEVFRVTAPDGRSVVVKQLPRESAAKGRSLRQELFVYRLAAWMPEVAALLPSAVYLDEARQVLVVECLDNAALWPDPAKKMPLLQAGVAAQVARSVAQLHRATAQMGLAPSPAAGVLGMAADLGVATQGRSEAVVALMHSIVADAALKSALTQGLAQYQHDCIIHGDLRPENWMGTRSGADPQLRLIDFEMAGSGDAAWDVGSLVAQAVIEALQAPATGPAVACESACESARLAAQFPWASVNAIQQIVTAYFEASDPAVGPLNPNGDATWHKLALFAAARLLHVATECADQGLPHTQWPVLNLVQAAKGIAKDINAAALFLRSQRFALNAASEAYA
jgi:aminoglycoside phosphotransferase (APT) family kinase protein